MENGRKENLSSLFEEIRIIEKCKQDTLLKFDQFCEFVAEPAFESLEKEFKHYRIKAKFKKKKGKFIAFQINFQRSNIDNFQYVIYLPQNSIDLKLRLKLKGRKSKKSSREEIEEPFLENVAALDILKFQKEELIQDVIGRYRDFKFEALTSKQ